MEVPVHIEDPELHHAGDEPQRKTEECNHETCFAGLPEPWRDLDVDAGEVNQPQRRERRPQDRVLAAVEPQEREPMANSVVPWVKAKMKSLTSQCSAHTIRANPLHVTKVLVLKSDASWASHEPP